MEYSNSISMSKLVGMVCLHCLLCVGPSKSGQVVIDLTHDVSNRSIVWPGGPKYSFSILSRLRTAAGFWFESNSFSTAEHAGTHVDGPSHFYQGSQRLHEVPPSRFVGPGVVIDVREKVEVDPDYRLSLQDIEKWERAHGRIPAGAIVMMWSGWDGRYPDPSRTFNTDQPTNTSTFHFPGFHPQAAEWILANRDVSALGVDTPSTDFGQSTTFETHILLGKNNRLGLENINNLGLVPPSGSVIFIGVTKIYDGSGGPARIMALTDGHPVCGCPDGGAVAKSAWMMLVLACAGVALSWS